MNVLVQANVLTVGLGKREQALQDLPIEIVSVQTAAQAARSLKNENFDSVIIRWDSRDEDCSLFLKRLRTVKPDISTMVLVGADDPSQEIEARSIGVSIVVTEDCSDEYLLRASVDLLGLETVLPERTPAEVKPQRSLKKVRSR